MVGESETQRQRAEDRDEKQREDRVVEQQRTLADDAHPHKQHHDRDEDAHEAERIVDEPHADARADPPAEVLGLDAQRGAFLGREQQAALVAGPAEVGEEDRESGEEPREEEHEAADPAGAVAVGARRGRSAGRGGRAAISGCHRMQDMRPAGSPTGPDEGSL